MKKSLFLTLILIICALGEVLISPFTIGQEAIAITLSICLYAVCTLFIFPLNHEPLASFIVYIVVIVLVLFNNHYQWLSASPFNGMIIIKFLMAIEATKAYMAIKREGKAE